MKVLLFLILSSSLYGMEAPDIETDNRLEKVSAYFLGPSSISLRSKVVPHLKDKVTTNITDNQQILWEAIDALEVNTPLSDISTHNIALNTLKAMVMDTVSDTIQFQEQQTGEARLQLRIKDKELRIERYKFYGALSGSIGIGLSSATAILTLIFSY